MSETDKAVYCEGNSSPSHWAIKYYEKDTYNVERVYWVKPEKLMLIGYMEEYLLIKHGIGVGNSSNIYIDIDNGKKYADIRYEQLEREIVAKNALKEKREE